MSGRKTPAKTDVAATVPSIGWKASPSALDTAVRVWKKNTKQHHDARIVESKQGLLWEPVIVVANLIMTWGFE